MGAMTEYQHVTADMSVYRDGTIKLHGPEAFEGMRKAGRLAAEILDAMVAAGAAPASRPRRSTASVREMTLDGGAVPATMGYRGYAHSCCISINHVVCHGIPSPKTLKDGRHRQHRRDPAARRLARRFEPHVPRRRRPLKARRLVEVTHECLMLGIAQVRPGARLGDIGAAIQAHAEQNRYGVVRDFCGHGLGRLFHDAPEVVHAARGRHRPRVARGHVHDHRADDQPRQTGGEAAQRRLDRGDPRQEPVGAVRALDRHYR
jgi:methionyl aminopeptidase